MKRGRGGKQAKLKMSLGCSVATLMNCADNSGVETDVVAVVLNLDADSANANTVSLFVDGERASEPQPLPDQLRGKELFPSVTFKGVTVHVNFGPTPERPLPFRCRMVQDASLEDVQIAVDAPLEDGSYEVLAPVCLPDEGTFEWLDHFLATTTRKYTELSDRMLLQWATRSGLHHRGILSAKASNDKPDLAFGLQPLENGELKSRLYMIAPVQQRHFIVMEVKGNLMSADRQAWLKRFNLPHFKRVAKVLIGTPDKEFILKSYEDVLKARQEELDLAFSKLREARAEKKIVLEERLSRKRQLECANEAGQKKIRLLADGNGDFQKQGDDAETAAQCEAALAAFNEEDAAAEQRGPDKAKLTSEEASMLCPREKKIPDVAPQQMSLNVSKFTIPEKSDGFDDIEYVWLPEDASREYMNKWMMDRKLTTRVEDLRPGDWYKKKLDEWKKDLQAWQRQYYDLKDPSRKMMAAVPFAKSPMPRPPGETQMIEDAPVTVEDKDKDKTEPEDDPIKDFEQFLASKDFDVFAVDDICNVECAKEPLFAHFGHEDFALLNLRFELHLLTHAFAQDCKDQGRRGIIIDHLQYYYIKYFKKSLLPKDFGVETIEEILRLVRDTIVVDKRFKIVESQLAPELDSNGVFVKLTEETRRDRQCRIDSGDTSAELHIPIKPSANSLALVTAAGSAPAAAAPQAGALSACTALALPSEDHEAMNPSGFTPAIMQAQRGGSMLTPGLQSGGGAAGRPPLVLQQQPPALAKAQAWAGGDGGPAWAGGDGGPAWAGGDGGPAWAGGDGGPPHGCFGGGPPQGGFAWRPRPNMMNMFNMAKGMGKGKGKGFGSWGW
eukprot:TRINITY_DN6774_c0_g1_i2.p1 TRINITY_DN6774_c0_g1~~TRINITY_DN6774_c0_g1_i2.p1  ORF type:complete len:838 (+),score=160.74 TRINITY_DN6774_c0_g1_i2:2-2515(+)